MSPGQCGPYCTQYVNCSKRGKGCTARKKRKRALAASEDEQCNPAATEFTCANCNKNGEKEMEILRRNVQILAGQCSAMSNENESADEDQMVTFFINETHRITAHRSILAAVSPVFGKMFSLGMLEKETGRVLIGDASLSTMEAVVKYAYTADITFTGDMDLEEVTHISHKYGIMTLTQRCETELCNRFCAWMKITVDLDEALAVTEQGLITADKYELPRLKEACAKELHLRNYLMNSPCPRSLAKMMHLSFKYGTEDIQDEMCRTVRNLTYKVEKQVWTEVFKI